VRHPARAGGLYGPTRHFHCAHCKAWAFTRPEGLDAFVNVRATMLDDHSWFVPFAETSDERQTGFGEMAALALALVSEG
jgi:hypothetical protein